jgi:hypothetical protein
MVKNLEKFLGDKKPMKWVLEFTEEHKEQMSEDGEVEIGGTSKSFEESKLGMREKSKEAENGGRW